MDDAWIRAITTAPPSTLVELCPPRGITLALRCYVPGCTACADFETQGRQAFESTAFPPGTRFLDWDCKRGRRRDLAMEAGVDELPSYVLLSAAMPVHVVRPS